MRSVYKPEQVPDKLIAKQNEIAEELYEKKEKFKKKNLNGEQIIIVIQ